MTSLQTVHQLPTQDYNYITSYGQTNQHVEESQGLEPRNS